MPRPPGRRSSGCGPCAARGSGDGKLPKPRSSTFSPRCSVSTMLPSTVSTMISARFFVRPAAWATSSMSATFVRLPSVIWGVCGWSGAVATTAARPSGGTRRGRNDSSRRTRPARPARATGRIDGAAEPGAASRRTSRGRGGGAPRQPLVYTRGMPAHDTVGVMSQRSLCSDRAPTVSLVAAWFLVVALWDLLVLAFALDALILDDGERVERGVTPTAGRSRGRRRVADCGRRPR